MICILITVVMFSGVIYADRVPFTLWELVQKSDLVVVGKVQSLEPKPHDKSKKRIARIVPEGDALKGDLSSKALEVPYHWFTGGEKPSPVQFQSGNTYCLFLDKKANGYVLINHYDGAHLLEENTGQKFVERVGQAIKKDKRWERMHKNLKLNLTVLDPIITVGDSPRLRFEVTNAGDTPISLPGKVLRSSGQLILDGYTSLLLSSFKDGAYEDQISLGRSPQRGKRSEQGEILPGETIVYTAPFNWNEFGEKPGKYQLIWKLGKATSAPVAYQVREVGANLGIDAETGEIQMLITNKSDAPVRTYHLGTRGNTLYVKKPSGKIVRFCNKEEPSKVTPASGHFDFVVAPGETKIIGEVYKTFTSSFPKQFQEPGEYKIWCDIVAWGDGGEKSYYSSNQLSVFVEKQKHQKKKEQ